MPLTASGREVARTISDLRELRKVNFRQQASQGKVMSRVLDFVDPRWQNLNPEYLSLSKESMQTYLRLINSQRSPDPVERAQAHYGLGLIALSQRDTDAAVEAGRELAKGGAFEQGYLKALLKEPDVPSAVRPIWEAALGEREQTGIDL